MTSETPPDRVLLYRFDDGWTIWRLFGKDQFRVYMGINDSGRKSALFGLDDEEGTPRSCIWTFTNILDTQLNGPISSSKLARPTREPFQSYWREFVEQTLGETFADHTFTLPVVIPDGLYEAMQMPEEEAKLDALIRAYEKAESPFWMGREKKVNTQIFKMVNQAFGPFEGFEVKRGVTIRVVKGQDPLDTRLNVSTGPETMQFKVSFYDAPMNWVFWEMGRDGGSPGKTLFEAWKEMEHVWESKYLRVFILESELDSWEVSSRKPGRSVYDLEAYFLLGTTSPLLLPSSKFLEWAMQQSVEAS